MDTETLEIVLLKRDGSDAGVFSDSRRGPFGTPLLFRGTEKECIDFIIGDREVIGEWSEYNG